MTKRTVTAPIEVIDVDGIPVEVVRKNVKNLNLRVRRDGTVTVSARRGIGVADISRFVASKRAWIERAQQRVGKRQEMRELCCEEGAVVRLWGQVLTCHLEEQRDPAAATCSFEPTGDGLRVSCPSSMTNDDPDAQLERSKSLERWLAATLKEAAIPLVRTCEELVGRRCSRLRFRRMTTRWGSCNVQTAIITLNTDLVHYPPECLRYVIIHELCHLYEPGHGARFRVLMDRFCPTWAEQRAILEARR